MPTDTPVEDTPATRPATAEATAIFYALANDRRRYTLHYLTQHVGAVPLGELAEQIAIWEGDPSRDRYERVLTALNHLHLPRLAECGLVTYDVDRRTVQGVDAAAIKPYLELAAADDFQ